MNDAFHYIIDHNIVTFNGINQTINMNRSGITLKKNKDAFSCKHKVGEYK